MHLTNRKPIAFSLQAFFEFFHEEGGRRYRVSRPLGGLNRLFSREFFLLTFFLHFYENYPNEPDAVDDSRAYGRPPLWLYAGRGH